MAEDEATQSISMERIECQEYQRLDDNDSEDTTRLTTRSWNSSSSPSSFVRRKPRANRSLKSSIDRERKVSFVMPRNHSLTADGRCSEAAAAAAIKKRRRTLLSPSAANNDDEDSTSSDGRMRQTYSDAAMNRSAANQSIADRQSLIDVSNQIMRASGYGPTYKWLLSNGDSPSITRSVASTPLGCPKIEVISSDHIDGGDESIEIERDAVEPSYMEAESLLPKFYLDNNEMDAIAEEDGSLSLQCKVNRAFDSRKDNNDALLLSRRRVARPQNFYALQKKGKDVYYTRKQLMYQRMRACDWSVAFALVGIALTVIESETSAFGVIQKGDYVSDTLKALVVFSTCVLLGLVVKYHWLTARIALISSGADDMWVTIQFGRIIQCAIELAICVICPFPGNVEIDWQVISGKNHRTAEPATIPLDAVLSVPMFLRSYLICRFIALHNRRYQDPATRSIAALNYVNVDFQFALKTIMHERPCCALVAFAVTFWISMSWLLTQCERYTGSHERTHYLNSIWLVIVTFTSIGYGDLIPQTYCGRALTITTGIMGAGVSSALIAVMSKRMGLTCAEKHVNNFITDSKLGRLKKHIAAAILQHTWFIHRYKSSPVRIDQHRLRMHQRKFLSAINQFRSIKWNQRRLNEQSHALSDLPKMQTQMHQSISMMRRSQDYLAAQMEILNTELDKLMLMQRRRLVEER